MTTPLVTIITATTCTPYLRQNINSVLAQTYPNVQHLVVIDGKHHHDKLDYDIPADTIILPYATGTKQYNGHRIYGAMTYIAKGDYIIYLDEDNWIEPNHVQSLINRLKDKPNAFGCSLRKITDMEGNFICNDDCESLGNWKSIINDYFVDVNCFFLPKKLALQLTPLWYRRARHPEDQPEVDRALTTVLKHNNIECCVTGQYTVNYRAGNRVDSVKPEFFLRGNEQMRKVYDGKLPWQAPAIQVQ
jgi:glycosyltransferase involved in cell wall biosynthesis